MSTIFKRWIVLKIHAVFDRSLYNSNRDREQLSALVFEMQSWTKRLEDEDYGSILDLCCQLRAITEGKDVHRHIVFNKLERDKFLGMKLTEMYGACGYAKEAQECFERICRKDITAWATVLNACSMNDEHLAARQLFQTMVLMPVKPDIAAYRAVLGACVGAKLLAQGETYHASIRRSLMEDSPGLCRSIIDMYGMCESLKKAEEVFERVKNKIPDAGIWISMVSTYAQFGYSSKASAVFKGMLQEGLMQRPSCKKNVIELLKSCKRPRELEFGKIVHSCAKMAELDTLGYVRVEIMAMYARCGTLEDARAIFDEADAEAEGGGNVNMFRAMMEACMWRYAHKDAIQLFREMETRNLVPDRCIILAALRACTDFEDCKLIHSSLKALGIKLDPIYKNYLVRNYRRCPEVANPLSMIEDYEEDDGKGGNSEWIKLGSGEYVKMTKKYAERNKKYLRRKTTF